MADDGLFSVVYEIDAKLFQAETGQIVLSAAEWDALEAEGQKFFEVLCRLIANASGDPVEEVVKTRNAIRTIRHMSATLERHVHLHPEPNAAVDDVIRKSLDNAIPADEVNRDWSRCFGYMFVERPVVSRRAR